MSLDKIRYKDIAYIPRLKRGDFLYQGIPCPTREAYELLGDEGVQFIHQRLAEVLDGVKMRFGENKLQHYGFNITEKLIDLRTDVVFEVGGVIEDYFRDNENIDLVIDETLKKDNYFQLLQRDHYIIRPHSRQKNKLPIHGKKGYQELIKRVKQKTG